MNQKENVKFEIVGLYPLYGIPKCKLVLSGHVYVITPDISFDIRGYTVHHHAFPDDNYQKCIVYPPVNKDFDFDESKVVRYPIISSLDINWSASVQIALVLAAKEFFEKFTFPTDFPRNYFSYRKLCRDALPKIPKPRLPEKLPLINKKTAKPFGPAAYEPKPRNKRP